MNGTRVLFVSKQLSKIGGIQIVLKNVASLLKQEGLEVSTLSFSEFDSGRSRVKALYLDVLKILRLHLTSVETIIYTITGYQVIIFSIISLLFKKKIIYWEHGNPSFLNGSKSYFILKRFFYKLSCAIVVTHPNFKSNNLLLPFLYIPNPYSFGNICSNGLNTHPIKKVIWVGRLSEEKQPSLALSAMLKSADSNHEIKYYFVCSPNEALKGKAPTNFFLIDGANYNPKNFLDKNTLLLLTSTAEAMPGVIFEALSNESTILSSECTPWIDDVNEITGNISFKPSIDVNNLSILIDDAIKKGNNVSIFRLEDLFSQINPAKVVSEWSALLKN